MRLHRKSSLYLLLSFLVFAGELEIARGFPGAVFSGQEIPAGITGFMRGNAGDLLVVLLLYFLLRIVLRPGVSVALAVGAGFVAEALQFFHVAVLLGIREGSAMSIALGTTASTTDLWMYVLGGVLALMADALLIKRIQRGGIRAGALGHTRRDFAGQKTITGSR